MGQVFSFNKSPVVSFSKGVYLITVSGCRTPRGISGYNLLPFTRGSHYHSHQLQKLIQLKGVTGLVGPQRYRGGHSFLSGFQCSLLVWVPLKGCWTADQPIEKD